MVRIPLFRPYEKKRQIEKIDLTFSTYEQKPNRLVEVLLGVFGILCMAGSFLFGLFVLGVAVLTWNVRKPIYTIRLGSSSGEADALSLKDGVLVNRIVSAINEAIIYRG